MSKNNYQVIQVPINKLSRDPSQPRTIFSKESIEQLAESIKEHGLIKNIEIDENYKIISGENRWRAAKIAGLKSVPCRILNLTDNERVSRQIHENIHHIPMHGMDVANAVKRYRDETGASQRDAAKYFGKSPAWVLYNTKIAEAPKLIAELSNESKDTDLRTLYDLSRIALLEKNKDIPKGVTKNLAKIQNGPLRRSAVAAITNHPDKTRKIMEICGNKTSPEEKRFEIAKIAPLNSQLAMRGTNEQNIFLSQVKTLHRIVRHSPYQKLGMRRDEIHQEMKGLCQSMVDWLKEVKKINILVEAAQEELDAAYKAK